MLMFHSQNTLDAAEEMAQYLRTFVLAEQTPEFNFQQPRGGNQPSTQWCTHIQVSKRLIYTQENKEN